MIPYPVHPDPTYKFKCSEGVCATGEPVLDSATSFTGETVCSSCRGGMELSENLWVHK
jgi:hypothetical protein